jgi:hypothetical protein
MKAILKSNRKVIVDVEPLIKWVESSLSQPKKCEILCIRILRS